MLSGVKSLCVYCMNMNISSLFFIFSFYLVFSDCFRYSRFCIEFSFIFSLNKFSTPHIIFLFFHFFLILSTMPHSSHTPYFRIHNNILYFPFKVMHQLLQYSTVYSLYITSRESSKASLNRPISVMYVIQSMHVTQFNRIYCRKLRRFVSKAPFIELN